jgi:phage-related protein
MQFSIEYHSEKVQEEIKTLPKTLIAKFIKLTERMLIYGPDLGMPHTRSMKEGLFEIRLIGKEGIARVFYCTKIGNRIVMLHSFIKKTNRTPLSELSIALRRMKEVRHEKP